MISYLYVFPSSHTQCIFEDRTRALQLRAFAVPVSVLLYEGRWLVDPSDSEEKTLVGSAACVALTCVFAAASGALLFLQQVR